MKRYPSKRLEKKRAENRRLKKHNSMGSLIRAEQKWAARHLNSKPWVELGEQMAKDFMEFQNRPSPLYILFGSRNENVPVESFGENSHATFFEPHSGNV